MQDAVFRDGQQKDGKEDAQRVQQKERQGPRQVLRRYAPLVEDDLAIPAHLGDHIAHQQTEGHDLDAAGTRPRPAADEHQDHQDHQARVAPVGHVHHIEPGGTGGDGMEERDQEQVEAVTHQVFVAGTAPFHHEDQQRPGQDEEKAGIDDQTAQAAQARHRRQTSPAQDAQAFPQHAETDAPQDDAGADDRADQAVFPKGDHIVRRQSKTGVAEG